MSPGTNKALAIVALALMLFAPVASFVPSTLADETVVPETPVVTNQMVLDSIIRGLDWYAANQGEDGGWRSSVGVTSFVLLAFAGAGYDHTNRTVERSIQFLRNFYDEESGSITDSFLNYDTSLALMALSAHQMPGTADMIEGAVDFQTTFQFTGDDIFNMTEDWYFGGWPNHAGIPDMSNTQFAILGMYCADLYTEPDPVDPAVYDNADIFTDNCQNWDDVNPLPWASNESLPSHNDGGFVYNGYRSRTPLGEQMFESYGSITAAGVFTHLVTGNDPRQPEVAAAREWQDAEYTLEYNPRLEGKGLYYYLWTQNRALAMSPQDWVVDSSGKLRDWRAESAKMFMDLQYPSGGWPGNPQVGWREEEPELSGVYAMLSMLSGYLSVPNPTLEVKVEGADDVTFLTRDGEVLETDATRGIQVSGGTLTCDDPEIFRKLWVDLEGAKGTRATVTATGTWGEDRSSKRVAQVEMGDAGGSAFIAASGFAGPFAIHVIPYSKGPALEVEKQKVSLTRGETAVIDIALREVGGDGPVVSTTLVTIAGDGLVADVDKQGILVPAGGKATLGVTVVSVDKDVKDTGDWRMVVTSATAPPVVIDIEVVDEGEDVGIDPVYWAVVVVLVILVVVFFLLPRRGKGGPEPGRGPDPGEE